jgi:hypothetical protein
MKMQMLRTRRTYAGLVVAAVATALPIGTTAADQAVEARAQQVCAEIGRPGPSSLTSFEIGNLSIRRDANGTVTLKRDGVKLGEIAENSYLDHTVCFVEVRALISSRAISTSAE